MVRVQIFSTAATLAILCASCVSAYRYGEPAQQPSSRRSTPNGDDVDIHGQQESYQPVDVAYNGPRFNTNDYGYRRRGAAGNAESGAGHNAPTSYGNRDVNRSLSQAKVTGHVTRTVSGKDYIIALENTSHFGGATWHMTLRAFVKSIAQELSTVGGGTNTLSLVTFGASSRRWLGRRVINRESVRQVVTKIDQMFDAQSASGDVKAGEALRFMRNSMYPNSDKYLLNDRTTELQLENAAGKDTVVILISSGMVDDKELALQEAFDARRNGVTLFVVEMSHKAEKFWTRLLGCRNYNDCPHYISSSRRTLPSRVGYLMRLIRSHHRKDALCLEDWSEYTTCSKPCDGGTKTSTLQGYQTLLTHSVYSAEGRGRTCDDQLRNIKVRQTLCNMQPCQPTTRSEARASSHEETDANSALPHATSMLQEVGEGEENWRKVVSQLYGNFMGDDEEEEEYEDDKEYYDYDLDDDEDEEINNRHTQPTVVIPELANGGKHADLLRRYGHNIARYIGECNSAGKNYVIALDNTFFVDTKWSSEIHAFVKLLTYALTATGGNNTLAVAKFATTTEKVMDRTPLNRDFAKDLGAKIDAMFDTPASIGVANVGEALRFMRKNLYTDSSNYLLNDRTTELQLENAAGKDTVVILISSGMVDDKELALQEAFDARRNGVTLFVVDTSRDSMRFWGQFLGCRYYFSCPNHVTTYRQSVLKTTGYFLRRICSQNGKDAVCQETWSNYSACSKPCDVGIMTAQLQSYRTLLTRGTGSNRNVGRTCEEQMKNVKTKQLLCNVQSCSQTTHGEIGGDNFAPSEASSGYPDVISESSVVNINGRDVAGGSAYDLQEEEPVGEKNYQHTPQAIQEPQYVTPSQDWDFVGGETLDADTLTRTTLPTDDDDAIHGLVDSDPDYLDGKGHVITGDTQKADTVDDEAASSSHGKRVEFITEPAENITGGAKHITVGRKTHKTMGKKTIIGGIVILVALCAIVTAGCLAYPRKNRKQVVAYDETQFLTGDAEDNGDVEENYKVSDPNSDQWQ
ncbi:thrombospondin-related adhesive protein [Babesia caballi]|uniref:Thrombospondin-related adhesive protein n=1 Tax=Babesia caballi TaxID=5871 RepID=A0AAV4M144_BABCB|nr:thrombospondin-related adhesive protein [Babesia caballi]